MMTHLLKRMILELREESTEGSGMQKENDKVEAL